MGLAAPTMMHLAKPAPLLPVFAQASRAAMCIKCEAMRTHHIAWMGAARIRAKSIVLSRSVSISPMLALQSERRFSMAAARTSASMQ